MSWKRQQLLAMDPAVNSWNIILLLLVHVDVVDEVMMALNGQSRRCMIP
jgi:hypothetical protein